MRALKSIGVAVVVFVIWFIGMSIVISTQHIGQTYDPTFGGIGAWFVDPAKQDELAIWTGQAVTLGAIVALGTGGLFFWSQRRAHVPPPEPKEPPAPIA
jgi:hypothetical protein